MLTVFVTRGLPASGKSTWAKKKVLDAPNGSIKRVNKDDLRAMLDVSRFSKNNERIVVSMRDYLIETALAAGCHVIVDDTNFEDKHITAIKDIARQFGARVEIVDFTDVPLEECIKRDAKRCNGVGKDVIVDMYNKYLKRQNTEDWVAREHLPHLPHCIIVDVDGTLAINDGHRGFFEWSKVCNDKPNRAVIRAVHSYAIAYPQNDIIIFSGREDTCFKETKDWLNQYHVPFNFLRLRKSGDMRKDAIVKREMFDEEIHQKYNVDFVLDDRQQVVDAWRDLGLWCFQVQPGDF